MVTYLLPHIETETYLEQKALNTWRLWNGSGWVHSYPTKEKALKMAGITKTDCIGFYTESGIEDVIWISDDMKGWEPCKK